MKIHQKLNLGFFSIIGPIILISLLAVWLIEDRLGRLSDFHSSTLFSIQVISSGIGNATQESFAYIISGNPHEKEDFLLWQAEIAGQLEAFQRTAALSEPGEEAEKALVDRIESGVGQIIDEARNMFDAYESTGSVDAEGFTRYEAAIDLTFQALDALIEIERTEVTDSQEAALDVISLSKNIIMAMLLLGLVLTFVWTRVITRFISIPLAQLRTASQALAQGNLDWKLEAVSKDELGDLTHSFRHMAEQLKKSRGELEEQVRSRTLELQTTVEKLQEEVLVRKRAEQALRESERKSQSWIENSPACTKIVDLDFNLQFMSTAGIRDLKIDDITEFYGKPYPLHFYPDSFKNPMTENLKKAKELGEVITQEAFVLDIHRNKLWYHSTIVPVHDDQGQLEYLLVVSLDITGRKQAEEEKKQLEAHLLQQQKLESKRFRELFENSPDAIFVEDFDGIVLDANPAAYRLHRAEHGLLVGRSVRSLMPPDQREVLMTIFANMVEGVLDRVERAVWTDDGEGIPVEISVSHITYEQQRALLLHVRDITDRKKVEYQLKASLREKEVLLKEIHHRVKNNLQIISSLLNLQASQIEDEHTRSLFRESQQRIRSMAFIHEKLYQTKDIAQIDLGDYIRSLARSLLRSYSLAAGQVQLDFELDECKAHIDTALPCGLIVNELVSNALKYAFPDQRQGILRIALKRCGPQSYRLEISDNGGGFPKGLDYRNTDSLGLQLVMMFVEQLEGTITMEQDEGTYFLITFDELKYKERLSADA